MERKAEIDRLKLELRTLKRFLEKAQSGFPKKYEEIYTQERLSWNPELERRAFRPRLQKVRRKKKSA